MVVIYSVKGVFINCLLASKLLLFFPLISFFVSLYSMISLSALLLFSWHFLRWDHQVVIPFSYAAKPSNISGALQISVCKMRCLFNIFQRDLHLPSFALLFDAISLHFTAPSLRIASQHCIFLEPLVSPEANRRCGQNMARSWEASCFSAMPMAESSPF